MQHELKTWPEYFNEVIMNRKPFEVRKNDRNFSVGDWLYLREFDPLYGEYTGNNAVREVTYVLNGGQFGIESGYVVMGLKEV